METTHSCFDENIFISHRYPFEIYFWTFSYFLVEFFSESNVEILGLCLSAKYRAPNLHFTRVLNGVMLHSARCIPNSLGTPVSGLASSLGDTK